MGSTVPRKDAWARARDWYFEDLSEKEQALYECATPESIFYDASAAEKTHASNSTSLKAAHKLQPLIAAIDQYGQALDVYSNAYPLVMSPLWSSIRVLLILAREFGKYFERIIDMLARIGDVLPRFKVFEDLFATHERLVQGLSLAYLDVLVFCTKAKAVFRHGRRSSLTNLSIAFKLSWKPFERQFGEQIDGFRAHARNVEKEASLSHMIEAAESRSVVLANKQQLEKMKKESQHRRMIAAIPSVNHEAKQKKLQKLRYEGTGAWILHHETFQQWKQCAHSSNLCCHSIPGCGKTVLASTIVDDLRHNGSRKAKLVYYYCDYADQRTLQTDNILGTLLKQFFIGGCIPEEIEAQLPSDLGERDQVLDLNELTALLFLAVRLSPASYLILDGFDECEKPTRQHIIQLIHELLGLKTVRIILTCREEDEILRSFRGNPTIRISSSALEGDIEAFVKGSVSSRITSGSLRIRNPNLEHEIVSELVRKAHGMFLWVFFQLDELCEAPSDAMIRQTLQNLPDGLGETYERILTRIGQNAMKRNVAQKVFTWILCARRPMRIDEVREAVAFGPSDTSWDSDKIPDDDLMIQSCKGLVIRDHDDCTVQFAHHTVRQYLLSDAAGQRKETFAYTVEQAEFFVGGMCLTYLSFSDFCTQIEVRDQEPKVERPPDLFKPGAALWIPNLLGVQGPLLDIPYRLLGGFSSSSSSSTPIIDFGKFMKPAIGAQDRKPSSELLERYSLLGYILDNWMYHTREFAVKSSEQHNKLQNLAKYQNLSFEFRPSGANQHKGPYGCKSCPPGIVSDAMAQKLPFMSLFHYAAELGHWPLMEPLVEDYCSHEDGDDHTLVTACRQGHYSIIKALTTRHTFNISNGKAVEAAAASGNEIILNHLLDLGESFRALRRGMGLYDHVVKGLLERGASINRKAEADGKTAISAAAGGGHDRLVKYLMDQGARTLTTMATPLHRAAENGHDVVVRTLLERDTYSDKRDYPPNVLSIPHLTGALDQKGETPMHKAARNGHGSVVKVLLEFIPLAGKLNLLSATTNINYPGGQTHGLSAIHLAASSGHVGVMALLSEHVSVDSRTTRGETALHVAADRGSASSIKWLASKNASTMMQDENGDMAADIAVRRGHEEAVGVFVKCGVYRNSAFMLECLVLAAREGHKDTVAVLDRQSAHLSMVPNAANAAQERNHQEAADLLNTYWNCELLAFQDRKFDDIGSD